MVARAVEAVDAAEEAEGVGVVVVGTDVLLAAVVEVVGGTVRLAVVVRMVLDVIPAIIGVFVVAVVPLTVLRMAGVVAVVVKVADVEE